MAAIMRYTGRGFSSRDMIFMPVRVSSVIPIVASNEVLFKSCSHSPKSAGNTFLKVCGNIMRDTVVFIGYPNTKDASH